MRILVLAPHPFFQERGTPIAERALLGVLTREGHRVHILTYHEGQDIEIRGCTIHRIPGPPFIRDVRPGLTWKKVVCDIFFAREATRMCRIGRYDLVHAIEEAAFLAVLLKKRFGLPFVYDMDSALTEQAIDRWRVLSPLRPLMLRFEKLALRESIGIVAVCRLLERRARDMLNEELRIVTIEDASLLSGPPSGAYENLREYVDGGGPIVLYVGNLEPYQGIDLLLRGFHRALRDIADASLLIIGGQARDIDRYQKFVRKLGAGNRIRFLGPRPLEALSSYLAQADILVSPRIEGINTPMKVFSYLASGTPVMATRLPTHTQVLDDDIAALFDPNPRAFADVLTSVLADPARRETLAMEAKQRVERDYSAEAFGRKLRSFYGSIQSHLAEGALGRVDQ